MKDKPNILFLMTDHQRSDTLFMVQCGREVTPNLNRLARESVVFERAYDACPLCVPARTALATGIYPTQNGVVYNDWKGQTAGSHEPVHKTLQKAGYYVGHVGVDHIRIKPSMREQNLDFFYNQEDYERWAADQGVKTARNPAELTLVKEEIGGEIKEQRYSGHKVSLWENPLEQFKDFYFQNRSLEFLEKRPEDQPFALFTYLWAPHPPLRVPEPYASMYDPDQIVLPDNLGIPAEAEPALRREGVPAQLAEGVTMDEWRKVWAAHLGLTTMADAILGTIIEQLKFQGIYEDTCIVFTADHGDHLGQHRMYQKMEMYEEAIHIPFLLKLPQNATAHWGVQPGPISQVVSHLDIKPTLCRIAGADPGACDGLDLLPLIRGEGWEADRIVFSQYSGNPGYGTIRRAAVSGQYKYVYDGKEHELYDLSKDPHEMHNVAGDASYQAPLQHMYTACEAFHRAHGDYISWEMAPAAEDKNEKENTL